MYKMPEVTNFKKKDNTYCCVPLCNSRGSKNPDLSFHLFPSEHKELARRRKWILALRIGRPVTSRMSVCSRHFVHSDYVLPPHYERKRPRLRKHAIPSLNLPPPNGYEENPEKRPTTIIIKKELSSVEAEEEKSEINAEQDNFEIEVNIQSEQDYFGTYYNFESEQDYFETDYNIKSDCDYLETDYSIEPERDYFETSDYVGSQRQDLEIIENELEYLETEDDIASEHEYLEIQNYLQIESNIESEHEDLESGSKIEPMTLLTLSKKLI